MGQYVFLEGSLGNPLLNWYPHFSQVLPRITGSTGFMWLHTGHFKPFSFLHLSDPRYTIATKHLFTDKTEVTQPTFTKIKPPVVGKVRAIHIY